MLGCELRERGEAKGAGAEAAEDQTGAATQPGSAGQLGLRGVLSGLMATPPLGQELSKKDILIPSVG